MEADKIEAVGPDTRANRRYHVSAGGYDRIEYVAPGEDHGSRYYCLHEVDGFNIFKEEGADPPTTAEIEQARFALNNGKWMRG